MTVFFPDISSYEAGLTIQPGTVAVIAKATEGTYYEDAQYANFKAQAARTGAIFSGYHFLKAGDGAAQADYYRAFAGAVPCMLDVETEGGSEPTVADCLAFIIRLREIGGRVWAAYFPQWFWDRVGGSLASLGVAVVSSNYTAYSDTGPGWAPYGGAQPVIWQYTNAQPYGGQSVDFNAFRGTVAELAALINGTTSGAEMELTDQITIPPAAVAAFPDFGFNSPTIDVQAALGWTAARTSHIANHVRDSVDAVGAAHADLGGKLDVLLARPVVQPVDVAALEAFIVQHQAAGTSAADLAAALVAHLGVQVVAK